MLYFNHTKSFTISCLFLLVFSIPSLAQEQSNAQVSNTGFLSSWETMSEDLSIVNDATKDNAILFSSLRPENSRSGGLIQSIISAPAATEITLKFKVWVERIGNGLNLRVNVHNKNDLLETNSLTLDPKSIVAKQWNDLTFKVNNHRALLQGANLLHLQLTVGGNVKLWIKDIQLFTNKGVYNGENPVSVYRADTDDQFNNGSQIETINTGDSLMLSNLNILGKVWGFMKYYHPAVRNGLFNWDYELFKIIPIVASAKTIQARNKEIHKWVSSFTYTEHKEQAGRSDDHNNTPFFWMDKSVLGDSLYLALDELKYLKKDSTSYYIQYNKSKAISTSHENAYGYMSLPDPGFRLLTAFKLWNHINYFYAYKDLLKSSWNEEMTPLMVKFLNAKDDQQYFLAFLSTLSFFQNAHVVITGNERVQHMEYLFWGKNWLPAQIRFINGKGYVARLSDDQAGKLSKIQLGDEIVSVNGIPTEQLIMNRSNYVCGSNQGGSAEREYSGKLFRTNDTLMNLVIKRKGKMLNLKVHHFLTTNNQIDALYQNYGIDTPFTVLENNIGYINMSKISDSTLKLSTPRVLKTKALILDLRGYPIALEIREFLSNHFFPKKVAFSKYSYSDPFLPGTFLMNTDSVGKENPLYYKQKVIVLVNEYTQSHSEYLAMICRQMPNSVIIGSQTAGADGDVCSLRLPGGLITRFESIGVYTPEGNQTQKTGIVADHLVLPDVKQFTSKKDDLLIKAISMLK